MRFSVNTVFEQDLTAANARIGVARSLYFSTISLTGNWGSASAALNDLFSGPSKIWSYAVESSVPIFTAGGIAGLVTSAKAVKQQTLYRYQQAIQNAFREVDDGLIDQQKPERPAGTDLPPGGGAAHLCAHSPTAL